MDTTYLQQDIKDFLEEKYDQYCRPDFITTDPIQIPHLFTRAEDIEISGFLAATIAWGQRSTIINNAKRLVQRMGNQPYEFIMNARDEDLGKFSSFKHRTFNGEDAVFFIKGLQHIYRNRGGLKTVFETTYQSTSDIRQCIIRFREVFFEVPHLTRTEKHVANILKNASAKRINMFLRWMVRRDERGIDFGLWQEIDPKDLFLPLDLHTGNVSRKLHLLTRKQNDWKAVEELTQTLRTMDPIDPIKYDYALFGLGIFEQF